CLRHYVGEHGDDPLGAAGHHREGDEVVAGEDVDPVAAERDDLGGLLQGAGRLLDGYDVLVHGDPGHGLGEHVDPGTAGHVVEDLRDRDCFGDRGVVAHQTFLGRLVVVGGHEQDAVSAGLFRLLAQFDRFLGRVGTGAGNDRNPLLHLRDDRLDHVHMLIVIERRGLAGSAARYDGIGPALDLELHQFTELFEIDLAFIEWSYYCDNASFKHGAPPENRFRIASVSGKKFPGQPGARIFHDPPAAAVIVILQQFNPAIRTAGVVAGSILYHREILPVDILVNINIEEKTPFSPERIVRKGQDKVPLIDRMPAVFVFEADIVLAVFLVKIVAYNRDILVVDYFTETASLDPEFLFRFTQEPFGGHLVGAVGQDGPGAVKGHMIQPAVIGMDDALAQGDVVNDDRVPECCHGVPVALLAPDPFDIVVDVAENDSRLFEFGIADPAVPGNQP